MNNTKARLKKMDDILTQLENLTEIEKRNKKNKDLENDLKIIRLRQKIKMLKAKQTSVRSKYGLVPRTLIDKDTGKQIEEV